MEPSGRKKNSKPNKTQESQEDNIERKAPSQTDPKTLSQLAEQVRLLKQWPRTGWMLRGVVQPESVAAHSYGVVFWTMWLSQRHNKRLSVQANTAQEKVSSQKIDLGKALSMATLHDLPEAATGDLIPTQKAYLFGPDKAVQKEHIKRAERSFWEQLQDELAPEWQAYWEEYRQGSTLEARLVKQADALDCVLQAIAYRRYNGHHLEEFSRLLAQASGEDMELEVVLKTLWKDSKELS